MARAVCRDCGAEWTGSLEEVSDAADEHDHWHDVDIQRVATDGGSVPPGPSPSPIHPDPDGRVDPTPREHPPGRPHHCDICDRYFTEIVELVDHACEAHDDEPVTDGAGHVLVRKSRSRSGNIYHHPHPEDPDAPRCRDAFPDSQLSSVGYVRRDPDTLDGFRLCKRCDPEYERNAGGGSKDHFEAALAAGQRGDR